MYKLSNLAADDFSGIYDDTLVNFGVAQADSYTDDLEHILESIIRSPLIGREYPEIAVGVRRLDYRQHAIFYRARERYIFILRILHQQMEPFLHFSDV